MSPELQKQLFDKYPKIFRQKDLDKMQTAMCWGIECRDGWYMLIDTLCKNLQFNTDNNNKKYIIKNKILRILIPFLSKIVSYIPGKYNFKRERQINPLVILRRFLDKKIDNFRRKVKFIYVESNRYPQVEAVQVKEKWGGLCFYTDGHNDAQGGAISFAESMSYHICERCGSTNDVQQTKGGWVKTWCKECRETK